MRKWKYNERDGMENEPAMDNPQWTTTVDEVMSSQGGFSGRVRSHSWPGCPLKDSPEKTGLPSK